MRNCTSIALLVCLASILNSCSTVLFQAPSQLQISQLDNQDGISVFSASCNLTDRSVSLYIRKVKGPNLEKIDDQTPYVEDIDCSYTGSPSISFSTVVLSSGLYQIYDIKYLSKTNMIIDIPEFNPIYFGVRSKEVVYNGRLIFKRAYGVQILFGVDNEYQEDVNKLYKTYPGLGGTSVKTYPFYIARDEFVNNLNN